MAPNAIITERVYASVKQQILAGRFSPGVRLEVKVIAYDAGTSITPVRDAIHRLIGERMLEFQGHGGFQVPILSEAALRDLYSWHLQLICLMLAAPRSVDAAPEIVTAPEPSTAEQTVNRVEMLFAEVTERASNRELRKAAGIAAERLRPVRFAELRVFAYSPSEDKSLRRAVRTADQSDAAVSITAYHQKRIEQVAEIVEAMRFQ